VGPKGSQGDTGPRGPQGLQGVAGPTGPKGPAGNVSAQGYDISVLWAAAHQDWSNKDFEGKDLHGMEIWKGFEKDDLGITIIRNTNFKRANLSRTEIVGVNFIDCDFQNATLDNADVHQISFENCNFKGASMKNLGEHSQIRFINCTMPDGTIRTDP
jgi:uncharacterized protein YjbI with pentapeptide repeats